MAVHSFICRTFSFLSSNKCLLSNRATHLNLQQLVVSLKTDTRDRLKELKIPEKPKKPTTPYVKFVIDHRVELLKTHPKIKQTDLIKKCAEDWKSVSSELKDKYTKVYQSECIDYDEKILNFNTSLTPEQREAIKAADEEKRADRKKRKIRKIYKNTNRPKRPMSPYMLYMLEQSKIKNISVKDLMTNSKGLWANLLEVEKEKYQKLYLAEKQKYEADMRQWEAKMLQEGHEDLVRVKSQDDKIPSRIKQLKKQNPE